MMCEDVRRQFALLLYGELSFDEEEAVESHLDGCAGCRAALEAERALHRTLDDFAMEPTPFELRDARQRLAATLVSERSHQGFFDRLKAFAWLPAVMKPAGALALVAMGFFGGRVVPSGNLPGLGTAGVFDPATARVRNVEPRQGGKVQIIVDETRQRVLSGRIDDDRIRGLLLAAVKDPSDPGLRVESVELLGQRSGDDEVRMALVNALQHDTNPGVRLKALDGLKGFAGHPAVRKALSQSLLADDNPSIRAQAIDLLMNNSQEQQLIGVLQELMIREQNGYIRQRCEKALHAMNASVEVY